MDKKKLIVRKIKHSGGNIKDLSTVLDQSEIPFHTIDEINWPNFNYCPEVKFRIAYDEEGIFLHYKVKEQGIRANYKEDNGKIWTDSCVEFFVIPESDGIYYNFEFNCIGAMLIGVGKERANRERASQSIMNNVKRYSTIGTEIIPVTDKESEWELSVFLPYEVFYKHTLSTVEGKKMKANFYKCGDELPTPHFLSWNRIGTEKPDFHTPDFFGEIYFEKEEALNKEVNVSKGNLDLTSE